MAKTFHELAFTDAVRAMQEKQGSAAMYARSLAPEAPADDRLGPILLKKSVCCEVEANMQNILPQKLRRSNTVCPRATCGNAVPNF